jgi:hypothetical protein
MGFLRIYVECFKCSSIVDKTQTILRDSIEKKYECYNCFRNVVSEKHDNVKRDYICEKCKFMFKSRRKICPYCSKSKFVVEKFGVRDLV